MEVVWILSMQLSYWFPEQPFTGISKGMLGVGWSAGEPKAERKMFFILP